MKAKRKIAALILAAGYSSRMGAFKPLLPLGEFTAIELAVSRFRAAGIADIKVVTGHKAEQLAPILSSLGLGQVFNADYKSGMLSSILAGRKSLGSAFDAFFLLPVDVPLFSACTVEALVREYERSEAAVVYPRFRRLRGHPPLISAALPIQEIPADLPGGLRSFLGDYEEAAVDVDVPDEGIIMDFDTPADYRKLQDYVRKAPVTGLVGQDLVE